MKALETENMIIYKVTNQVNGKVYIGQTQKTFNKRYCGKGVGVERIANSPKVNLHLASSIRKYGAENFIVEIIDRGLTVAELNEKEKFWIEHYDSTNNNKGYNVQFGGDNHSVSEERRTQNQIEKDIRRQLQLFIGLCEIKRMIEESNEEQLGHREIKTMIAQINPLIPTTAKAELKRIVRQVSERILILNQGQPFATEWCSWLNALISDRAELLKKEFVNNEIEEVASYCMRLLEKRQPHSRKKQSPSKFKEQAQRYYQKADGVQERVNKEMKNSE